MLKNNNLNLSVTNFGPIVKAEFDLRPLTVFVGPGNTGKSYLAILIYVLHRFFNGDSMKTDFSHKESIGQVFYPRNWVNKAIVQEQGAKALFAWQKETLPSVQEQKGFLYHPVPKDIANLIQPSLRDTKLLSNSLNDELARCFGINDTKNLRRFGAKTGSKVTLKRRISGSSATPLYFDFTFGIKQRRIEIESSIPETDTTVLRGRITQPSHRNSIMRYRSILDQYLNLEKDEISELAHNWIHNLANAIGSQFVEPLSHSAYYLPASRTGVMHGHRAILGSVISRASRARFSREDPWPILSGILADFLEQLVGLGAPSGRSHTHNRQLCERFEEEILQGKIINEFSNGEYNEFYYVPTKTNKKIPVLNSSSMVSELAPVLLYLRHIIRPDNVLLIEEPESHLHPAGQVKFIELLAAAVRAGVRVLLTTHSEWVLEELANLVRMSDLPESQREGVGGGDVALTSDDVGVWLFEPKKRPRGSVVKEIPLDQELGGFASGYEDVAIGTYNKWARIGNLIEESHNGS